MRRSSKNRTVVKPQQDETTELKTNGGSRPREKGLGERVNRLLRQGSQPQIREDWREHERIARIALLKKEKKEWSNRSQGGENSSEVQ